MNAIEQIRTELRYLVRELGLLNRDVLNSGMTLSQAHLLSYLRRNGPTPFGELQLQFGMDKASLSRTVSTLGECGYLRVVTDPADRRARQVELLPPGKAAIADAEGAANTAIGSLLGDCDEQACTAIHKALRRFRLSALRTNLGRQPERLRIETLRERYQEAAMALLYRTFAIEQHIPAHLIPLPEDKPVKRWCIRIGEEIIGFAAAWNEAGTWHWGRFAVDAHFRGLGIGKKLAIESLGDLFAADANEIVIDARDVTVEIVRKLGGEETAPAFDFYGAPVTPMLLRKAQFQAQAA